ncbi:MAG: hypothetical protein ABW250_11865, partial [Pyrinomonadaceae bacterium]
LGQAMHQVRSASADFKRTWETEALLETAGREALAPAATEARQELVPGDTEAQACEVGETHTPAHEAQAHNGLTYVNREAALGEV